MLKNKEIDFNKLYKITKEKGRRLYDNKKTQKEANLIKNYDYVESKIQGDIYFEVGIIEDKKRITLQFCNGILGYIHMDYIFISLNLSKKTSSILQEFNIITNNSYIKKELIELNNELEKLQ